MTDPETKICPACTEPIKRVARICPRCREWQTLWSIRHPATFCAVYMGCFLIIEAAILVIVDRAVSPQPDFSHFRDQIAVTESKLSTAAMGKDTWIAMIGIVTNRSDVSWKNLQFDCRFLGPNGDLMDASTREVHGTVFGHDTMAFRFDVKPARPPADYASYEVTVRFARNAREWP